MRRLDDNAGSRAVVQASDSFGWFWNIGVGLVLLVAGLVLLVVEGERDDTLACFAFGTTGVLVGAVLRIGRQRRREGR